MTATVSNIIHAMDNLVPRDLAEKWDNPGLQIGDPRWPVQKVWVALDPTEEVVKAACRQDVDMLITHHPLIFTPLQAIDVSTFPGNIMEAAFTHHLAIFSAHTNLDVVYNGANDTLARRLGLENIVWLDGIPGDADRLEARRPFGFARLGTLKEDMRLVDLAMKVKAALGIRTIKVAGSPDLVIKTVATCCGSGSGMVAPFLSTNAQVLVSGDLKYHDARNVEASGVGLMDIGHFASEHLVLDVLAKALYKELANHDFDVMVQPCALEKDPFMYY